MTIESQNNQNNGSPRESHVVEASLKSLLVELVGDRPELADFGPQTRLRDLGINSVDYMKFVLTVEQTFDLEIPDAVLDSNALTSVGDWSAMLCNENA